MADVPDLYATLDLERDASPAAVKKAYRKKAKAWHPDVNQTEGAKEQFARVQLAYSVLSDPARRAKYDATGTIDADDADNSVARLLQQLAHVFNEAMTATFSQGQDPTHTDILQVMVDILLDNEEAILAANNQFARNRAVLVKMVDRFETEDPDAPNHMETILRGQIADIDRNVITNKQALEHARVPRLYLEGCRYRKQDPLLGGLSPNPRAARAPFI